MNLTKEIDIAVEEGDKNFQSIIHFLVINSEDSKTIHDFSSNNAKITLDIKKSNGDADLMYQIGIKNATRIFEESMSNARVQLESSMMDARSNNARGEKVRSSSVQHKKSMKDARAIHRESVVLAKKICNDVKDNAYTLQVRKKLRNCTAKKSKIRGRCLKINHEMLILYNVRL